MDVHSPKNGIDKVLIHTHIGSISPNESWPFFGYPATIHDQFAIAGFHGEPIIHENPDQFSLGFPFHPLGDPTVIAIY